MSKIDSKRTKILGLTMKLDLRLKQYEKLCKEFENLKENNVKQTDEDFIILRNLFLENQKEIKNINDQLEILKNE